MRNVRIRTVVALVLAIVFMQGASRMYAAESGAIADIVMTIGSTTLTVNGEAQETDVAPFIADGRTMVPLRIVSEALGADVHWDGEEQAVTIVPNRPYTTIFSLFIGEELPDDMGMAMLQGGRTFVPLRHVAERLGVDVDWNAATQTIFLGSGNADNDTATTPAITEEEARAFEREVFEIFNATRNDTGIIDRRTGNPITISQPVEWWNLLADAARWRSQSIEFYDGFNFGGCPQSLTFRVADYPTPEQIVNRVHEMLTPLLADYGATFTESMGVGYDAASGYITIAVRLRFGEYAGIAPAFIAESPYRLAFQYHHNPLGNLTLYLSGYSLEEISDVFEREMLRVVNEVRAEYGLNPVAWSDSLGRAARVHSHDMTQNMDTVSHTGSDGSSPTTRARREGWRGGGAYENITGPVNDAASAVRSWMHSTAGHRENILNPSHTHIGAGIWLPGHQQDFLGYPVLKLGS
ncbi:MAG: stalk domain-containing protein [Defluviitaleaceae bacterium]|nr:stalk domain-containing protein [Defluviitaleaceae bacterium]MCL2263569.1 stalk domain-containing protein [Defluviitaleaceae bacterium]